jgi:hypothetical protein
MVTQIVESFLSSLTKRVTSEPWAGGELVTTPWGFRDGEPVALLVRQQDDGSFLVSDRGAAADSLLLADVDLDARVIKRSWSALRDSLEFPLPAGSVRSVWEFAAVASADQLGAAMQEVAEVSSRADGLRNWSGKTRQRSSVGDRLLGEALRRDIDVMPHARIESKFGARRSVTAKLTGRSANAYVQAIGRQADPWNATDKARSLFADSSVPNRERFTLVEDGAPLRAEHLKGIEQHSRVVLEHDMAEFLEELAA